MRACISEREKGEEIPSRHPSPAGIAGLRGFDVAKGSLPNILECRERNNRGTFCLRSVRKLQQGSLSLLLYLRSACRIRTR